MHPPHRHRRRIAAGFSLPVLLLAGLPAAGSADLSRPESPPDVDAAVAGENLRTDLAPGTYEVTLITGDQVRLNVSADRHVAVDVMPAVRADGPMPEIEWYTAGDGVYVIPEDARPHLNAGYLDWNLFDVEHLARIGFTDDAVDGLPLIVEYGTVTMPGAEALRSVGVAAAAAEPLPSIDGAAIDVDQDQTTSLWQSVHDAWSGDEDGTRSPGAAPRTAIDKVWLDDMTTLTLAESVPQIGAPEAWSAGLDGAGVTVAVLDSGIDLDHPDVAGKVADTRGFLGDDQVIDGHGHGTHVATTIAGRGAASDGRYTGVAPAAELVIGKVCDDNGDCPTSAVIAGMEWAAQEQDAEIINLSLGGGASNGGDPMSQAVNRLSADTGALFVISAGNSGGLSTIGSPGAADAALTVAAVDKSDRLANFSSRGPRMGDSALKPEIAAPGVGIVAGRAAGTEMGSPVGAFYTAADGTSMAAPHAAGAAALLAQRRPDWDGQRIKAALIASSHDGGDGVYEVGSGRVDVARAVDQQVEVSPAVADFRFLRPEDEAPSHTLTYRNPTAEPVTLSLAATIAAWPSGATVPDGTLTLQTDTLTVPARGSATVTVNLDHSALSVSRYSGSVVATAGDLQLTTPVGAVVGDQNARVTVDLTGLGCDDGVHCSGHFSSFGFGTLSFYRYDDVADSPAGVAIPSGPPPAPIQIPISADMDDPTASVDVFVERGRYAVAWEPRWLDAATNRKQQAELWIPQVEITEDRTMQMDANRAVKVRHLPALPVGQDGFAASNGYTRTNEAGESFTGGAVSAFGLGNFWTYPSESVTDGGFLLSFTDVFEAPQVAMTLNGGDPVQLNPIYSGYRDAVTGHQTAPIRFPDGDRTLEAVDLGVGAAQDYVGIDVSGKLVLLEQTGPDASFCSVKRWQLDEALKAGAVGVLYDVKTCAVPAHLETTPIAEWPQIPFVAVPQADADLVRARLQDGPVEIDLSTRAQSPYTYYAKGYVRDEVPEAVDFTYADGDVMRVEASFHSDVDVPIHYGRATRYPEEWFLATQPHDFGVPTSQIQYIGPVGPDLAHVRRMSYYPGSVVPDPQIVRQSVFAESGQTIERWNADPWVPGFVESEYVNYPICAGCREGNLMSPYARVATGDPAFQLGLDPVGWGVPTSDGTGGEAFEGLRVYRNDELVEPEHALNLDLFPYWRVPQEEADYRVELDLTRYSDDSSTAWEFRSGQAADSEQVPHPYLCIVGGVIGEDDLPCRAEPFIFLRYAGLDTDLRGAVPVPGVHRFEVEAYRQVSSDPQPPIAGLRLWTSYDGGETWREARVKSLSDGRYSVMVIHPPAVRRGSDTVTVRAEAWDAEGNRVTQTLPEAYTLDSERE